MSESPSLAPSNDEPTALAIRPDPGSPLPVFTGKEMAAALVAYKELQAALDRAMPDQIMQLDGKPFRKRGYWRAVAVAFNLRVEAVKEDRGVDGTFDDQRENFGWTVTYRATAPNGRCVTGDGSCFAVEKARRFKCSHRPNHWPPERCPDFDPNYQWRTSPAQATEHNIRSHAHTRAFNRAVSNLVGFGEVSADELVRDDVAPTPAAKPSKPAKSMPKKLPAKPPAPDGSVYLTDVKLKKKGDQEWAEVTTSQGEQVIARGELIAGCLRAKQIAKAVYLEVMMNAKGHFELQRLSTKPLTPAASAEPIDESVF